MSRARSRRAFACSPSRPAAMCFPPARSPARKPISPSHPASSCSEPDPWTRSTAGPRARDRVALTGRRGAANVECVTRHVVLWLLVSRLAAADPRIVLVETRGAPELPALASQIELQAGRRVTVHAVSARQLDPMTYAEQASQLVAAGEASIVVWIAAVDRGYLVFAAGGWPGRALIELVRVDAELGAAEIERTIALKIAGLLDAAPRAPIAAAVHAEPAGAPGVRAPDRWVIEVGGVLAHDAH